MSGTELDAQIILCDAAVADPGGKVHMLGAGWSQTGTPTAPHAVAVLAKIPWDRANERIPMVVRLVDADGRNVGLSGPDGEPVQVETHGEFEVGRPPGMEPGSPIDASFAMTIQSMPLPPGRYEWQLELAEAAFSTAFQVRAT